MPTLGFPLIAKTGNLRCIHRESRLKTPTPTSPFASHTSSARQLLMRHQSLGEDRWPFFQELGTPQHLQRVQHAEAGYRRREPGRTRRWVQGAGRGGGGGGAPPARGVRERRHRDVRRQRVALTPAAQFTSRNLAQSIFLTSRSFAIEIEILESKPVHASAASGQVKA